MTLRQCLSQSLVFQRCHLGRTSKRYVTLLCRVRGYPLKAIISWPYYGKQKRIVINKIQTKYIIRAIKPK